MPVRLQPRRVDRITQDAAQVAQCRARARERRAESTLEGGGAGLFAVPGCTPTVSQHRLLARLPARIRATEDLDDSVHMTKYEQVKQLLLNQPGIWLVT